MPSRYSWMTMLAPAVPKALLTRISSIALFASAALVQIKTPLPRARPSALTAHLPSSDAANFFAWAASENVPAFAVGMPYFSMKCCEKTLDDSNCAAFRFGPQMRKSFFWNKSTMPSASGLSGPTTVSSTFFSCANASSFGKSSAPRFTHSTGAEFFASRSCAMPALPGAHHSCVTCGDCASFHTSACSRPPEPMTRSFIKKLPADYAARRVEAMRRRDGVESRCALSKWDRLYQLALFGFVHYCLRP